MRAPRSLKAIAPASLLLLTAARPSDALPPAPLQGETADEIRFAVLGDTQFANMGVFERMVHEINLMRPDFATQVGDLINGYTPNYEQLRKEWRQYRSQLEPLTIPFYPVPGNHDVVTPESERVYGEEWGEGRYYYSWDYGPVHCISLDTYWADQDDRVAQWQRDWMANDLAQWAERMGGREGLENKGSVFVFTHSPIWRQGKDSAGRKDWEKVHEILLQYPTRLVVGGHTHEYVWEKWNGGPIDYIVINSSGGQPDRGERGGSIHSFLHVSVENGTDVRYAVVKAGSILPLDTVNNRERERVPRHSLTGGTLRVEAWEPGKPFEGEVTVPVSNPLDKERVLEFEWNVPEGADVTIDPDRMRLRLAAGEEAAAVFRITTPSAPRDRDRPRLEVSSTHRLRSGVVSRDWERIYKEREAALNDGATTDVLRTNIPLEQSYTWTARWDLFAPRVVVAAKKQGEVVIDGNLDDAAWQNAEPTQPFTTEGGGKVEIQTQVRFLYDQDHLYIAARMEEPNPAGMIATAEGDIPLTWNDDDLELFFDPEQSQSNYARLFLNKAGTRFSSMPRHIENKYFQSKYKSAIHIGEDHWIIEMEVPWSDIWGAKTPESGQAWNLNIGRHRPQSATARSVWSADQGRGLYDPTRYGVLRFE